MAGLIVRNGNYHVQWYEGKKKRRRSLRTDSLQIAKERLRQFESARFRGEDCPLPTRTPIGEVVAAYIAHSATHKTRNSLRGDTSYLREAFGECCDALRIDSSRARKCRERRCPEDGRKKLHPISAPHFEAITTAEIEDFIAVRVRVRGLKPKTANRYREVIAKVFNWAITTNRVSTPGDRNPARRVSRYREPAPDIRFLSIDEVGSQLDALEASPLLKAMVATLIYAGLRREELLWLQTHDLIAPSSQAPNGLIRVTAKQVGGVSWQPKTKRNRAVPVSQALRSVLNEWTPPDSDHSWLFPSPHGRRWDPDNFSQTLARKNRSAGLAWTCLHFRHTFGSQLAQRGMSLLQIATLMGNSPEVCRRHYAALVPETMAAAVDFGT